MADSLEKVLQNEVVFKSVYELIEPSDTLGIGDIYKVPFTKIYQSFDLYKEGKVLEVVSLISGRSIEEILKSPSNQMMKFMKWLAEGVENCAKLLNSIPSVKDDDMMAAGVSSLDQFGEFNIYYSITKDPTRWDELGKTPFEIMFTKLKMDGENAVIQNNYNEIIKRKK